MVDWEKVVPVTLVKVVVVFINPPGGVVVKRWGKRAISGLLAATRARS